MEAEQLDLFVDYQPVEILNGFYYERSTNKFVSFVLGRRHYEISAYRSGFPVEWQNKMKKERAI